jgi:alpha-mannosidase
MHKMVAECQKRLKQLLLCANGSTAPVCYAFGHGHPDVAWHWPLAETEWKAARTLAGQIGLAEEYQNYTFFHSRPHLFRMVEQRYPTLYKGCCNQ